MKTAVAILLTLAVMASSALGQDYEDEKPIIRTRQARGPSLPRNLPRQQLLSKTTTTTTEAPVEEEEYTDEELQEGELIEEEAHTTTTEAPKKPLRGVVRPFRSNEDLIEALKRRRAQAGGNGRPAGNYPASSTTTTEQPTERQGRARNQKTNGRFSPRGGQSVKTTEQPTTSEEPRQRGGLFSARGGRRF